MCAPDAGTNLIDPETEPVLALFSVIVVPDTEETTAPLAIPVPNTNIPEDIPDALVTDTVVPPLDPVPGVVTDGPAPTSMLPPDICILLV